MNTHDIELPPLPTPSPLREHRSDYSAGEMQVYATAAIEADRKRRGEPVAWLYEDELPDNYPYEAMFPYSKVDGVRMFPVYAPQPTDPSESSTLHNADSGAQNGIHAPQPPQIPEGYKLVPQRLISLCEQLTKWRNCMSYNDSYFGEPDGDLKRIAAAMERAMLEAAQDVKE